MEARKETPHDDHNDEQQRTTGTSTPSTRASTSRSATWWSRRCEAASPSTAARIAIDDGDLTPVGRRGDHRRREHRHRNALSATRTCARPTSSTSRSFPELRFRSTRIEKSADDRYRVTGDLTIRDVTREVALDVEYGGRAQGSVGQRAHRIRREGDARPQGLRARLEPGARGRRRPGRRSRRHRARSASRPRRRRRAGRLTDTRHEEKRGDTAMLAANVQTTDREIVDRTRGHKRRADHPPGQPVRPRRAHEAVRVPRPLHLRPGETRRCRWICCWHPHSGIATVTVVLDGCDPVSPKRPESRASCQAGGVEWMRAGNGVWHTGAAGRELVRGFQLWVALPPELENGPTASHYVNARRVPDRSGRRA